MNAIEAVSQAFTSSLASNKHGAGELVTMPIALGNGNLVQVYVERVSDELWFVSDEGQTAGELALAGVNLSSQKNAAASWEALVRSLPISPPVLRDHVGDYVLAGQVESGRLGIAMLAIAEAAVRGDGLRALAPGYRARRFRDVIVQSAGRHDLPVLIDAPMPTHHGGSRRVSVKVAGAQDTYLQAISGKGSVIDGFDKAQAVLSSANVPKERLVAVLARSVRLEAWQWETLRDHGIPIVETELDHYMEQLAA